VLFIFDNLKLLTFSLILNCPVFRGTYSSDLVKQGLKLVKVILVDQGYVEAGFFELPGYLQAGKACAEDNYLVSHGTSMDKMYASNRGGI